MKGCIREMNFDDLESILEIENECFKMPWTKDMFLSILSTPNSYSVVYEKYEIIGYGMTLLQMDVIHIANIAVRKGYRQQGIGGEILLYLLQFWMGLKKKKALLEVRPSNLPAISFYKKFGFCKVGIKEWYYPNGEDAIIMQRDL
ncbi:ribosomal protein S18-alanine N-acetyltransferase [candidate division WOR-3 bacterium]|nr:ribosomal protein S18-alanine N-acetyltransferase [candidate division WOR-3 bacterium]